MANENKVHEEEQQAVKADKQKTLVLNPENADDGAITITTNVIAQIIKKNVLEVEGVARFAPKGVADLVNVFSSRAYDSSIAIEFVDGAISVTVAVLAFTGVSLPTMAAAIQNVLREQILNTTGAKVGKINVQVKDLVSPDEVAPEEKAGEAEEAE